MEKLRVMMEVDRHDAIQKRISNNRDTFMQLSEEENRSRNIYNQLLEKASLLRDDLLEETRKKLAGKKARFILGDFAKIDVLCKLVVEKSKEQSSYSTLAYYIRSLSLLLSITSQAAFDGWELASDGLFSAVCYVMMRCDDASQQIAVVFAHQCLEFLSFGIGSSSKIAIFMTLLDSSKQEPLFLKVIHRLNKTKLQKADLRIYYKFVSQLFASLRQAGIHIAPELSAAMFDLSKEFIGNNPIDAVDCAKNYLHLPSSSPKSKDLQYLINVFAEKLATSVEEKAPQIAYIDFLAAIENLDILNVKPNQ